MTHGPLFSVAGLCQDGVYKTSLQDEFLHMAVYLTPLPLFLKKNFGKHVTFICVLETPTFINHSLTHTLIHIFGLNSSGKCRKPYPRQQPALCSFGTLGDFKLHLIGQLPYVVLLNWWSWETEFSEYSSSGVRRSQRQLKEICFLLF